jgi:hypothetical protein
MSNRLVCRKQGRHGPPEFIAPKKALERDRRDRRGTRSLRSESMPCYVIQGFGLRTATHKSCREDAGGIQVGWFGEGPSESRSLTEVSFNQRRLPFPNKDT